MGGGVTPARIWRSLMTEALGERARGRVEAVPLERAAQAPVVNDSNPVEATPAPDQPVAAPPPEGTPPAGPAPQPQPQPQPQQNPATPPPGPRPAEPSAARPPQPQ